MDLRRLRTFVIVADQGTVSRAALQLRITQPALSRRISDLERELGLKLFDRVGRRLLLTADGEQLLANCRTALGYVGSVTEQAALLRSGGSGMLKVAAPSIIIEAFFATFLPLYAHRHPKVQIKLIEAVGADTVAMLERGAIHIGVSLLRTVQADDHYIGTCPLPSVEILAACCPSFRLEPGETIDIGRVVSQPLLLLDPSFAARKTFDAICRLADLRPNILIESHTPHTLLALAEAGNGIAIIPSGVQTHRHKLRIVRVTHEGKVLREPLAILWDKRRVLSRHAQEFCDEFAGHVRELFPVAQRKLRTPARKRGRACKLARARTARLA